MSLGRKMEFNVKCCLRVLWTAVAMLVFLSSSSAAPFSGGTDRAMVSLFIYLHSLTSRQIMKITLYF